VAYDASPNQTKVGEAALRSSHCALQLPQATRALFIRKGREKAKRELTGVTAQDALTLFLRTAVQIVLLGDVRSNDQALSFEFEWVVCGDIPAIC
jgi:hypothetical protein